MKNQEIINRLRSEVQDRYGVAAEVVKVVRSPYRICPLGAYVDHQLGCVTAGNEPGAPVFLCNSDNGAKVL